ncbi:MAG: aminopeptidase P family protein [Bacteriovoracaceae bacterium]
MGSKLDNLKVLLKTQKGPLYLSSFDYYLNEYVPKDDNLRLMVSGFTGSVAEMIVFADRRSWLFVDGRYHEQADLEVDHTLIEVVKVPYGTSLTSAMFEKIQSVGLKDLVFIPERTSVVMMNQLAELTNIHALASQDVEAVLEYQKPIETRAPIVLDESEMGEGRRERLERLFDEESAFWTCALDSIAWLSGIRGFQLPFQATFRAYAFATRSKLYIFTSKFNVEQLSDAQLDSIEFHEFSQIKDVLSKIGKTFRKIGLDPSRTNAHAYALIQKIFDAEFNLLPGFLVKEMAKKNAKEIEHFKAAFERSDRAIYNSLCWLKEKVGDVSENDWNNQTTEYYKNEGMIEHSFRTISGFGENGSIIHYGTPSKTRMLKHGDVCLLDSGAYYRDGHATDCTRTVLGRGEATADQKKQYTLVLKGLLAAMNAKFKEGTLGKEIDALTRAPIQAAGFNYAHGTGHGVGINVHEGGYSVTPFSEVPLLPNRIGSLEPGIYIPGVGGVRLENVVQVVKDDKGMLGFKSLCYIGFDADLIAFDLLTDIEKQQLKSYEQVCQQKGRSFGVLQRFFSA